MAVRLGKQTIALEAPVSIVNTATVVGTKESEGPLACLLYTSDAADE